MDSYQNSRCSIESIALDNRDNTIPETYHLLTPSSDNLRSPRTAPPLGEPQAKSRISILDILGFILSLTCLATALVCVLKPSVAVSLGQTNQLIVIGFLLSLMGYCTTFQVKQLLLAYEAQCGRTTLQNLDALLTSGLTGAIGKNIRTSYRISLLLLFALPLVLSVGYKTFTNGSSRGDPYLVPGSFGATGPPGIQNIGFGLSLFVNATIPWFEDPGFQRAYGFNMWVDSDTTTIMVDGPLPGLVDDLQSKLKTGESIDLTADVSAFVCSHNYQLSNTSESLNNTFYAELNKKTMPRVATKHWITNQDYWVGFMSPNRADFSTIWISWWFGTENFGSHVQEYSLSREKLTSTWRITPNSISLINTTYTRSSQQDVVEMDSLKDNVLAVGSLFIVPFTEFDSTFRYVIRPDLDNTKYNKFIKNDASLVASAVWARIVALNGPEVGDRHRPNLQYNTTAIAQKTRTTLRRDWKLVFILTLNPFIIFVVLISQAVIFYKAPIGEGFGLISILAAAKSDTLHLLQGAGLSGKLSSEVKMHFDVQPAKHYKRFAQEFGKVEVVFGEGGKSSELRTGEVYS
ncbi:hypothetical protein BP6252_10950 [Coleophoma cylindrospora]|uniref:Uncharacterized protein n=1 Tax=Coleophoma cylindrospora TaxID=1849047 RepID=A0A3D8QNM1_9HELO|nr:hypothetical protein BP6252_10950 [Coleophoma cylindrospora]